MKPDKLKILADIERLIKEIDDMECALFGESSKEEFVNLKESLVVGLDEIEDLIGADSAYEDAMA